MIQKEKVPSDPVWKFFSAGFVVSAVLASLICRPADPDYVGKVMKNQTYSGFISRDFFQVVVEVPYPTDDMTILEEREYCKEQSISYRDDRAVPLLVDVAMENPKNKKRAVERFQSETDSLRYPSLREKISDLSNSSDRRLLNFKNADLNRGAFSWFLGSMFLHKEDYSVKNKCTFIYRLIEKDLFAKVENTLLPVPVKPVPAKVFTDTSTGTAGTGTATSTGTGLIPGLPPGVQMR